MRAIVVDDEKLALESMRVKLTHIGRISEVHAFSSPEAALEYFAKNGGDIAFLDVQMPRINGLALAERMREIKPNVIVIFVTGYEEYALDAMKLHADGYLMKPMSEADIEYELDTLEQLHRKPKGAKRIRVQCFGRFEVFVDGIPVTFSRSKSKELLAYLVDRRGASCASEDLADILWEDGRYDRSRQKQLSKFRREMIIALENVGAEKMIGNVGEDIAVKLDEFDCDYYKALSGDAEAIKSFMGEYMVSYSWAEATSATLVSKFQQF